MLKLHVIIYLDDSGHDFGNSSFAWHFSLLSLAQLSNAHCSVSCGNDSTSPKHLEQINNFRTFMSTQQPDLTKQYNFNRLLVIRMKSLNCTATTSRACIWSQQTYVLHTFLHCKITNTNKIYLVDYYKYVELGCLLLIKWIVTF